MRPKLVAITTPVITDDADPVSAEQLIAYAARVSNPGNQNNHETAGKLLKYCIVHGHWSVFETVSFTVEIVTSRAISAQILRHRSFTFQEFSQRYAMATEYEPVELRSQDTKNRQGSGEIFDPLVMTDKGDHRPFSRELADHVEAGKKLYHRGIVAGVSKETARMLLPLCTQTTLYVTGNVRSWIHYLAQRCSPHAQKEHRLIATEIRDTIFAKHFPNIHSIL